MKLRPGYVGICREGELWMCLHREATGFENYTNPMRVVCKYKDGRMYSLVCHDNGQSEPSRKPSRFDITRVFPTREAAEAYLASPWYVRLWMRVTGKEG
jgi:hypothetical protein